MVNVTFLLLLLLLFFFVCLFVFVLLYNAYKSYEKRCRRLPESEMQNYFCKVFKNRMVVRIRIRHARKTFMRDVFLQIHFIKFESF